MSADPSRRHSKTTTTHGDLRRLSVPPHSIEAEQAVLGALMLVPESYDRIADTLTVKDFYRHDHQQIYLAACELAEANKPFDAVTLGEWFESQGKSELVGGGAYLIELATSTPSAVNILAYAQIVREKFLVRTLISTATDIVNDGFNLGRGDAAELLAEAEQKIFSVGEQARMTKREIVTLKAASKQAFTLLQRRYDRGGGITGQTTSFDELDDLTAGLGDTDLVVLAARPAMGKTTLAMNIAEHVAAQRAESGQGSKVVLVFSMEMSADQLALRSIASIGQVDANRLRRAQLEDEDWAKVTSAIKRINEEMTMLIDDTGALSPDVLRAKARRAKRDHPDLSLIVVDYLQLMQIQGSSENRATEIGEISRSLKALAKELKVPVIALSQLNRSVESRADKRPLMSDLRESGAIEQDADMIIFIYRDDYYNKDSQDKGIAEIILSKSRSGPTGMVRLGFDGAHNCFRNLRPGMQDDAF
ncbi:DNA helicase [Xanthomonas euvesicatoria]|uniref:replicative DNA helicase n=1 Tax=Xanthomonas euvesicatoria TaxID=456327 RepID=UPI00080DD149|nr:replicative DNA helicase [Xanthomonas euvesicatoria]OCG89381.1 DNA helicase [Xanthomonas euvesicatoria]